MPPPERFWKSIGSWKVLCIPQRDPYSAGEILHVDLHGQIQRDHLHLFTDWCSPSILRLTAADHDLAMLYARSLEMTPAEVETLLSYGFTESDLDEMAFDRQYREECKAMCL